MPPRLWILPLLSLVATSPLVAEPSAARVDTVKPAARQAMPLFVELGPEARADDQVRFEIRIDGSVIMVDELQLTATPQPASFAEVLASPTPVVELLAAQPARLEALRRAARDQAVEVTILHGDAPPERYTLSDLQQRSEWLIGHTPILPFGSISTTTLAAQRRDTKSSCIDRCDDEQDHCYTYRCERFGAASCYDACDQEWNRCLDDCGLCQPSTTSTTTTTTDILGVASDKVCIRRHGSLATGHQRLFDRRYTDTTTTTTTHDDCSQTVTTSVSYRYDSCWKWVDNLRCIPFANENPNANCS